MMYAEGDSGWTARAVPAGSVASKPPAGGLHLPAIAAGAGAGSATLGLTLVVSAAIFLVSTRHGIGAVPDSFRYLGVGWDMGGDAPLYGWLLRPFIALQPDRFAVARWVGLALMLANTAALWTTLVAVTRSVPAAALGTALVVASPQYLLCQTSALSEPLFLLLSLAAMGCFLRYVDHPSRWRLAGCGAVLALATLARFPAVALGAAMAACLLLWPAVPLRRRLADIAILAGIGVLVTGAWALVSTLTLGHSVGRDFRFHGNADAARWLQAVDTLTALLVPTAVPRWARVALLLVLAAFFGSLVWTAFSRWRRGGGARLLGPFAYAVGAVLYCCFMGLAIMLEANLPFNGRYAAPFHVFAVIAAVAAAVQTRGVQPRWARRGIVAFAAVLLATLAGRSAVATAEAYRHGIGFTGPVWRASPTLGRVAGLPPGATIYSNGPEAVFYVTGRPAGIVPMRFNRRTGRDMPDDPLAEQLRRVRRSIGRGPTYIVFLDGVDWRFYLVGERTLAARLGLRELGRFPDGRIYTSGAPEARAGTREGARP